MRTLYIQKNVFLASIKVAFEMLKGHTIVILQDQYNS